MRATRYIDQLTCNARAVGRFAYAALEHIPHAQFAADLLHVDRPALVDEGGITGYDKQPFNARQAGNEVFDHAVGKIVLLRITTHVGERQ